MDVIENLIPVSLQNQIEQTLNSDSFPWFFMDSITSYQDEQTILDTPRWDKSKVIEPPGLVHMISYDGKVNSNYYELCRTILYFLEHRLNVSVKEILRIRIRRTLQTPGMTEDMYNIPHVDVMMDRKFYTLVYYVEESDGDTIFFDQIYQRGSRASLKEELKVVSKIPHKKGNAVLFEGHRFHAGNCPMKYTKRTIINFDFII